MRWGGRVLVYVTVVLLGVAVLAGPALAQPATPMSEDANWLFTVNFRSAALVAGDDGTAQATLTLAGVDTDVLAFTDRPQRRAGLLPVDDFAALVDGAAAEPPNALLVTGLPDGSEGFEAVLVLRSAAHDRDAGSLTFEVTITGRELEGTPEPSSGSDQELPAGYLFVDDLQGPARRPINVCGNPVGAAGEPIQPFGNVCTNA